MAAPTTGRFVWHELHTSDRTKAQSFYSRLLGWQIKEMPMGPGEPYTVCSRDGQQTAGITKSMAPATTPPHWLAYVAVDDVDASATKAKSLGGKVLVEPTDIPEVGRFARIADPQGASFALFKDAHPYAPEPERPPAGSFCWDELATSNPEAAANFYAGLFGYAVEAVDMGPMGTYRILKRGDRQTAGITKMPAQVPHPNWLAYLAVQDVDASTRNAKELLAKVLMEPMDIPNIGRFAIIADPTGAAIALFKGA
jgi:predicted enzyme related to lactoylglutathione lyase